MDNKTNDKLNATLGKMGVMEPAHSSGSASSVKQSSDKGFYLIMTAMVVGMGFYVSYDMDKRYGANTTVVKAVEQTEPDTRVVPVVVGDIPIVVATEKSSETSEKAAVVEAVDKQESVTAEKPVETEKQQQASSVVLETVPVETAAAPETQQSAPAPALEAVTPAVEESELATPAPPAAATEEAATAMETAAETSPAADDVVAAPVVEPAPASVTEATESSTSTPTTPATTAATVENNAAGQEPSAYYPYGYNYGRPYQGGYYQQPYGYDRSYYYQYRNPYGYGYPYQQPPTTPAE